MLHIMHPCSLKHLMRTWHKHKASTNLSVGEVLHAIKSLQNGKSAGTDGLPAEFIKYAFPTHDRDMHGLGTSHMPSTRFLVVSTRKSGLLMPLHLSQGRKVIQGVWTITGPLLLGMHLQSYTLWCCCSGWTSGQRTPVGGPRVRRVLGMGGVQQTTSLSYGRPSKAWGCMASILIA